MILFHRHYGAGNPLIILHGLFGQSDNWAGIAKVLGNQFSVYCMDMRNHGQSPHHPDFSYEAMANDVLETLYDLRLNKIHLLGHSMGGKAAMFFAQNHPEKLHSLISVDIGPRYYAPHHTEIIAGLKSIQLETIKTRSQADEQFMQFVPDSATRQFLLKNLVRTNDQQFVWRFNLDVIAKEIEHVGEALPPGAVNVPTLFYRGEHSNYILPEEYPSILQQFPEAVFKTMQGAGHWLHAEKPQEFMETCIEFLNIHDD
jgi:pimeloyl-ACP methyl ester carboxylesterase